MVPFITFCVFKMSNFNNNKKIWRLRRNKKVYLYTGIKTFNKTLPVGAQTLDVYQTDFQSAIWNMFKGLKEIISGGRKDKVRSLSHPIGNTSKEIEIMKKNHRNSVVKMFNYYREKYSRDVPQQIWASIKLIHIEDWSTEVI